MVAAVVCTVFIITYISIFLHYISYYCIILHVSQSVWNKLQLYYIRTYIWLPSNYVCLSAPATCPCIDVILCIQYEEEWYRVQEEAGYVTLALVLKGNASVPVTVTVRTLGLQDSSVGATPTGELFRF